MPKKHNVDVLIFLLTYFALLQAITVDSFKISVI